MRKIYADNSSIRDPKFYTEPDYANYKYVLNLPGKTDGSYSRNLNHLWYVGAAVLRHALSRVVLSSAEARRDARRGQSHDGPGSGGGARRVAGQIRAAAGRCEESAKELTSPEAIARYVRHVVDALRRAQAQHLIKWGAVLAGRTLRLRRGHRGRRARARAPPLVLPERQRRRKYVGARRHALHKQRLRARGLVRGDGRSGRQDARHVIARSEGRTDKPEAVGARRRGRIRPRPRARSHRCTRRSRRPRRPRIPRQAATSGRGPPPHTDHDGARM